VEEAAVEEAVEPSAHHQLWHHFVRSWECSESTCQQALLTMAEFAALRLEDLVETHCVWTNCLNVENHLHLLWHLRHATMGLYQAECHSCLLVEFSRTQELLAAAPCGGMPSYVGRRKPQRGETSGKYNQRPCSHGRPSRRG